MVDQAEKLRQLVRSKSTDSLPDAALQMNEREMGKTERRARIVAITSGKGGVGKTSISTNLAIELALLGKRVTIFDADLSLANIDVLLGLRPRFNLNHVINGDKSLEDIMVEGPHGIRIIPASSGIQEMADMSEAALQRLIGQFAQLERECDFLLVDTAAGISDNVLAFLHAADEILIVTTPEPTAYTDAYAMIKVLQERNVPAQLGLIVNMAQSRREALNAAEGIVVISQKFLQAGVKDYGYLLRDPEVPRATRRQEAFTLYNPSCAAARSVRSLARLMAQSNSPVGKPHWRGFMDRFAAYFRAE